MAAANGVCKWRQQMASANGGGKWRQQMASANGGSRWRLQMYGASPAEVAEEIKKEMTRATGKDMDFKEIEDLIVKLRVESLKKELGPIPIDK